MQNRLQGRSRSERDPSSPQIPIIQHADVRRMLLAQKSYASGALALCLYAAKLTDDIHSLEDSEQQKRHNYSSIYLHLW